jgi:hypothetical protein
MLALVIVVCIAAITFMFRRLFLMLAFPRLHSFSLLPCLISAARNLFASHWEAPKMAMS